jgi:hypothetical protein
LSCEFWTYGWVYVLYIVYRVRIHGQCGKGSVPKVSAWRAVNGRSVNRRSLKGRSMNVRSVNGRSMNVRSVNGSAVNRNFKKFLTFTYYSRVPRNMPNLYICVPGKFRIKCPIWDDKWWALALAPSGTVPLMKLTKKFKK